MVIYGTYAQSPLRCPPNVLVYRLVQGLGGVPDVPHAANVSLVTEGSGVGVLKAPPVSAWDFFKDGDKIRDNPRMDLNTLIHSDATVTLSFKITLASQHVVSWETIVNNGRLFVEVPSGILPEGSKESLVTLLEYAEEKLRCSHVVLCFKKTRSDAASMIRAFMFMGFRVACPGDSLVPTAPDIMFMVYDIEPEDEDD